MNPSLNFAAVAAQVTLHLEDLAANQAPEHLILNIMADTARTCMAAGACLIGHIKCMAEAPDGSYLICSVLDAFQAPEWSGRFLQKPAIIQMRLNLLLYGLHADHIRTLLTEVLQRHLTAAGGRFEMTAARSEAGA